MRYLFTTLMTYESDFYGRVGEELARRGHDVSHLTVSRAAARELRERGASARSIHDVARELPAAEARAEAARIEGAYALPTIRAVYRVDRACDGRAEDWCVRRTVAHFRAVERVLDEERPDVLVPEVGNETIRQAVHRVGVARGIPVLFLLYTIFPNPLRLYVDTLHAPIVPHEELRELSAEEVEEVEAFRRSFTRRAEPIRGHRRVSFDPGRLATFAGHVRRKLGEDADNEYLRPGALLAQNVADLVRGRAARTLYGRRRTERPFVYFPLHVTDDYKIKAVIPHCVDQASIVEQLADALPPGYDLVLKEHPMSVGRNPLDFLARLRRRPNVRLLHPFESSHELVRDAAAVAVISSTVGLEALLYERPVLTLGEPFYAGYGITLDLRSFAEIRDGVPALLRFRPDPERIRRFLHAAMRACYPGAPVLVDRSQANALALADSLELAGRSALAARGRSASDLVSQSHEVR